MLKTMNTARNTQAAWNSDRSNRLMNTYVTSAEIPALSHRIIGESLPFLGREGGGDRVLPARCQLVEPHDPRRQPLGDGQPAEREGLRGKGIPPGRLRDRFTTSSVRKETVTGKS